LEECRLKNIAFIALLLEVAGIAIAQAPKIGTCTVLPADDIWNTRIDQLPVHPSSSTWVSTIGASSPLHPDFGSGLWDGGPIGIPYMTVPGTQTKYPATFTYQSESDTGPYAIPLNAPIEGGSASTGDRHATAIDIDHCLLYEIFSGYPQASSWTGGSGAIFNLLSSALRPATWTSADAAGLPIFPGLVRHDEVTAGAIHHALRFTVQQSQKAYVWPARHCASSLTGAQYPPMGARFRLKASFNISGFSTANQVILTALKQYGMILADNGANWFISGAPDEGWNNDDLHALTTITGANFEAVDATTLMVNPDSGQAVQGGVAVSISPQNANVSVNSQKQFTASVTGDPNQAVTWDVNGAVGGNATAGFIDSVTGLYTAPALPTNVTVHASTSVVTPAAVGSASVTVLEPLPIVVTLSPKSVSVRLKTSKQFTATVKNTSNTSVTWKVNAVTGGNSTVGTISGSGLYRAPIAVPSPSKVTVTATSNADTSKAASATVTITRR
jgi:hypothetical protein